VNDIPQDDDLFEADPIAAYCVRCRESVEMDSPTPVWTRKGMPATRGECPLCGGVVFRMGKTDAHRDFTRPAAIQVGDGDKRRTPLLARDTVYVNFSAENMEFAQSLAADLNNAGVAAWLHETETDSVAWAGGVHPALKACDRMVYILSAHALSDPQVITSWEFFRGKRKPIVIAQVDSTLHPPDAIRRSPRFDFAVDYKSAFRQMLQALSR
jgi:hypothetical protein